MNEVLKDFSKIDCIIKEYVKQVRELLGDDYENAVLYGSYARGTFTEESDIDIAIFTEKEAEDFYLLVDKIAEVTFEYNVKYNVMISPVFQNVKDYNRWINVLPYYQNIQREGIAVG